MILPFLSILRPLNLTLIFLTQVIIYYFLIRPFVELGNDYFDISILSLTTVLIAGAGYLINDYFDQEIDAINKSKKVIIGKKINPKIALFYYFSLTITAIILAFSLNLVIGAINLLTALLLFYYAYQLKKTPLIGNLLVAFLSAFSLALLGIYFDFWHQVLIEFIVFAFLISLIREIIKDIEDIEGDKKMNSQTLVILFGERKAKNSSIFVISLLIAALFFVLFEAKQSANWDFWHLGVLLLILQNSFLLYLVHIAKTKKEYSFLSAFCKFIMFCGIILIPFIK